MSEWIAVALAVASAALWHLRTHHTGRTRLAATVTAAAAAVLGVLAMQMSDLNPLTPWVLAAAAWTAGFATVVLLRPFAPRQIDRSAWILSVAAVVSSILLLGGRCAA